jgi:hypothetical protein
MWGIFVRSGVKYGCVLWTAGSVVTWQASELLLVEIELHN